MGMTPEFDSITVQLEAISRRLASLEGFNSYVRPPDPSSASTWSTAEDFNFGAGKTYVPGVWHRALSWDVSTNGDITILCQAEMAYIGTSEFEYLTMGIALSPNNQPLPAQPSYTRIGLVRGPNNTDTVTGIWQFSGLSKGTYTVGLAFFLSLLSGSTAAGRVYPNSRMILVPN